jgi:hypothetical protein
MVYKPLRASGLNTWLEILAGLTQKIMWLFVMSYHPLMLGSINFATKGTCGYVRGRNHRDDGESNKWALIRQVRRRSAIGGMPQTQSGVCVQFLGRYGIVRFVRLQPSHINLECDLITPKRSQSQSHDRHPFNLMVQLQETFHQHPADSPILTSRVQGHKQPFRSTEFIEVTEY